MIKFVVVEDNKLQLNDIKSLIMNYMLNTNYKFDILSYDKISDNIFKDTEDTYHKYIFLFDYQLPNGTAVDIARRVRENDWVSPIVIFTINTSMALSTFKERLQILDYVIKDENLQKNLLELFDICLEQLNYKETFKINVSKMSYIFEYDRILYIYKCNNERKIEVVTDQGNFKFSMTLEEIMSYLTKNFIYTHKACIVNKKRVKIFDWKNNCFILDTGESVYMLSRLRKKELMECANS